MCTTVTDVYIITSAVKDSCISGLCRCIIQQKGVHIMSLWINAILYGCSAGLMVAIPLVFLVYLYMFIRKHVNKHINK